LAFATNLFNPKPMYYCAPPRWWFRDREKPNPFHQRCTHIRIRVPRSKALANNVQSLMIIARSSFSLLDILAPRIKTVPVQMQYATSISLFDD
jgi:hypothetical protein